LKKSKEKCPERYGADYVEAVEKRQALFSYL
jgi:hypothetical protein